MILLFFFAPESTRGHFCKHVVLRRSGGSSFSRRDGLPRVWNTCVTNAREYKAVSGDRVSKMASQGYGNPCKNTCCSLEPVGHASCHAVLCGMSARSAQMSLFGAWEPRQKYSAHVCRSQVQTCSATYINKKANKHTT